jgi:acyl carrier protein
MDIKSTICKAIAEVLNMPEADIDFSKSLGDDLGADSLDQVEIMMIIEDDLGITINEDDYENLKNLADLEKLLTTIVGDSRAQN